MPVANHRLFSVLLVMSLGCASTPPSAPRPTFDIPAAAASQEPADLLTSLSSADSATRAAAAWALASTQGNRSDLAAAIEPLRSDPDRSVRYAAAWALGRLQGPTLPQTSRPGEIPPKVKRRARPKYPQQAFDDKVEGTVLVEALIGEQGEVAYAEVRKSVPGLDGAALEAVRQWEFEPMQVGGVPEATVILMPVAFRIY